MLGFSRGHNVRTAPRVFFGESFYLRSLVTEILHHCIHGFLLEPFAIALQIDVTMYNLASTLNFNYMRLTHLLKLNQLPQTYCAANYCAGCN